ncbi:MAG: GNAT family N-acetyltransferase [Clostridiaceae bacterium]|jgi:RimJ/RimL family protein N-acetyltransferase|nr:GNAT family N-acetyltransferase [Clostridiaceae bacterium]
MLTTNNSRSGLPLRGPRVDLTAIHESDIPNLLPFFQDMASLTYFIPTTARPLNATQIGHLMTDWNDGVENFIFAVRVDGWLVGLLNLDGLDWPNGHSEIGIALTEPAARGHGLAAEALTLMIRYAFDELGLKRIWARVIEPNTASRKLFETLNFTLEGRLRQHILRRGDYHDMLIYGLLNTDQQPALSGHHDSDR